MCDSSRDEHSTWEQLWTKLLTCPVTSMLEELQLFKFKQINQQNS